MGNCILGGRDARARLRERIEMRGQDRFQRTFNIQTVAMQIAHGGFEGTMPHRPKKSTPPGANARRILSSIQQNEFPPGETL